MQMHKHISTHRKGRVKDRKGGNVRGKEGGKERGREGAENVGIPIENGGQFQTNSTAWPHNHNEGKFAGYTLHNAVMHPLTPRGICDFSF